MSSIFPLRDIDPEEQGGPRLLDLDELQEVDLIESVDTRYSKRGSAMNVYP